MHTTMPPKLHFNILRPSSNSGSIPNLPLFASNPHNSNQTIMGFPPMVSSANSIPKSPEAPSKAATLATPAPLAAAQPSLPPLPLIAPTSAAPVIQRPPHPAGGQTASRKSTTSSPSRTSPNSNSNSANNKQR